MGENSNARIIAAAKRNPEMSEGFRNVQIYICQRR
jgi:hypothetical protein